MNLIEHKKILYNDINQFHNSKKVLNIVTTYQNYQSIRDSDEYPYDAKNILFCVVTDQGQSYPRQSDL